MRYFLELVLIGCVLTCVRHADAKKKSHHSKLKALSKDAKLHPESSKDQHGTKKQVLGLGGIGANAGAPGGTSYGDEPVGTLGGTLANSAAPGLAGLGDNEARQMDGPEGINGLGANPNGGLGGDAEGIPTGMGAGAEPLGFTGQGNMAPFGAQQSGGLNDLGLGGGPGGPEGGDNSLDSTIGRLTGGLPLGGGGGPEEHGLGEPVGAPIQAPNFPGGQDGSDASDTTAALAKQAVQDNNALGELVKNADKIQDDSPGDGEPEGHGEQGAPVTGGDESPTIQNLTSEESAGIKSSQDLEATSMNGAQAVLGMQGSRSMKRYMLKKSKKSSKKSKRAKKPKPSSA